jgi:hypothetical protein
MHQRDVISRAPGSPFPLQIHTMESGTSFLKRGSLKIYLGLRQRGCWFYARIGWVEASKRCPVANADGPHIVVDLETKKCKKSIFGFMHNLWMHQYAR